MANEVMTYKRVYVNESLTYDCFETPVIMGRSFAFVLLALGVCGVSCAPGWYSHGGTYTPCQVCAQEEREVTPCSAAHDRVCAACTVCASDEREVSPCMTTADRVCEKIPTTPRPEAQHSYCNEGFFLNDHGYCEECTVCEAGEVVATPCGWTDTVCAVEAEKSDKANADDSGSGLSAAAIAGIVIGAIVGVILLAMFVSGKNKDNRSDEEDYAFPATTPLPKHDFRGMTIKNASNDALTFNPTQLGGSKNSLFAKPVYDKASSKDEYSRVGGK